MAVSHPASGPVPDGNTLTTARAVAYPPVAAHSIRFRRTFAICKDTLTRRPSS